MTDAGGMATDLIKNSTGTAQNLFPAPAKPCAPKEPKMGGPTQTHCRETSWCGGKPRDDWTDLESPPDPAADDPLPTQMRSKDLKAAIAQLKRAEGIHSSNKKKFTEKKAMLMTL